MSDVAGDTLFKLPEILDLTAAEGFLELVRQHSAAKTLCMDASAVRTLTVPCVQIILAAARSHEAMSITEPSAAFISTFEDLGIDWMQDIKVSEGPSLAPDDTAQDTPAVAETVESGNDLELSVVR